MYSSMHFLVHWPDRENLLLTMPMCFNENFPSCAVIIDCFEVFIDRPSDLLARAQTWSSYKHHNTDFLLVSHHNELYLSFQEGRVVECPISLSPNIADYWENFYLGISCWLIVALTLLIAVDCMEVDSKYLRLPTEDHSCHRWTLKVQGIRLT